MFSQHNWNNQNARRPFSMGDEHFDSNFGFKIKIKKPKIKIKAPKISVKKIVPKITVNTKQPLKTIANAGGDYLKAVNPLNQIKNIANLTPVTKDLYKEADKLTGGSISQVTRASNLSAKFLKGEKITSQDIMEAVTVAAKIGAVVASGGSAAALIGVGAGALKQGPLGQTSFGRNFLTLAEVGGTAYALYSAGAAQAAGEASKQTAGQAVEQAVTTKASSIVRSQVEEEFEKKTGIPVTVATKIYDVTTGNAKIATLPKDIAKVVAEEQLKKAGLGNTVTQAILSNNAKELGVMIKDAPNLALSAAQRKINAEKVKLEKLMSLEGLKAEAQKKTDKYIKEATDTDALRAKIEKEANAEIKKQLQKQLDDMIAKLSKSQKESVDAAHKYQLESAQASVMIAAAEEGRYELSAWPYIAVGAGVLIFAGALWYYQSKK